MNFGSEKLVRTKSKYVLTEFYCISFTARICASFGSSHKKRIFKENNLLLDHNI